MSVAKSYEKYEVYGEPYEHNKRQYVKIKYTCCRKSSCSKCGGQGFYLKEVRWYEEPITFNARQGFGFFEKGYITIFKGPREILDEYFKSNMVGKIRYNLIFLWHLPSSYEVPDDLPKEIKSVQLKWEQISTNNITNDYDEIKTLVGGLLNEALISEFVGEVNGKIDLDLVVIKDELVAGYYGDTHMYHFEDEHGNCYLWKTSARKLDEEEIYHLKGTIKEHLIIEGIKYTILTRCREG